MFVIKVSLFLSTSLLYSSQVPYDIPSKPAEVFLAGVVSGTFLISWMSTWSNVSLIRKTHVIFCIRC